MEPEIGSTRPAGATIPMGEAESPRVPAREPRFISSQTQDLLNREEQMWLNYPDLKRSLVI